MFWQGVVKRVTSTRTCSPRRKRSPGSTVEPGDRFLLGEQVLVEVTRFTTPCQNIVAAFKDGDFTRVSHKLHPGWSRFYVRVLQGGVIRRGDAFLRVTSSG